MSLIRINHLCKTYRMGEVEVSALQNIAMKITAGEKLALYGASGSGKTTLLNIIGCIDAPTSGEVRYRDTVLDYSARRQLSQFRLQQIGFVFQSYNLMPVLSAYENIEYPLLLTDKSKSERARLVDYMLKSIALDKFKNHKPKQLSGGQRQRVAIGRALVNKPTLVIADEPTANLDVVTSKQILNLISDLNRTEKNTVIIATHDPLVRDYVDRSVMIRDGKIREVEDV
ncbi:ABC transporter ATP-binding protein [Fodinibius halophilus]|uniref:ABC transporter ATP-binding protein n=1 Tax=Fodinibius halophilus TaxID=1736908 RepID=A0A6M1SZC7_9BACT|nr:ABC transporter ATP-binding protein [Fodinibius halophilus]NGP86989.1 ABC transporter ATP-binding protein [Fodinibius halophilus]